MAAERVIRVKILVEAPGAAAAGNEAAGSLERVAGSADNAERRTASASSGISNAAKVIGVVVAAAAVLATKAMLGLGMAYESSLNSLQAVTGATASQMGEVSAAAKALGNDISIPGASASDAAEAMTELAKGGLDVTEAMTAARGTLQLAAAAQISGAQAATIQADSLNAFHLEADQAGKVADVLANAANAATGEISDFGQGLAQSSAVAYSMGVSLTDNVTALGLFANAGVKGSDAGTSLKTMLQSLQNPTLKAQAALDELGVTVYDAQGNFVGMRSVTDDLAKAKERMSQQDFNAAASTVFGSDAVRAAQIIAEGGTAAWDDMSTALGKVGGAAELAAANSKGLKGAIDTVKNSVETAALTLYEELSPSLETAVRSFSGLIDGLAGDLVPALAESGSAILDLGNALEPLIPALVEALVPAISAVAAILVSLTPIVVPVVEVLGQLLGWVAQLPEPILAAAAAFTALAASGILTKVVTGIQGMAAASTAAGGAMAALGNKMRAFFTSPAGIAIGVAAALAAAIGFLVSSNEDAEAATESYGETVSTLADTLDRQTLATTEGTRANIAAKIGGAGYLGVLRDLGINTKTYLDAIEGVPGAQAASQSQIVATAKAALEQTQAWQMNSTALAEAGVSSETFTKALLNQNFDGINAQIEAYNSTLGATEQPLQSVNLLMGQTGSLADEAAAATQGQTQAYVDQNGMIQVVKDSRAGLVEELIAEGTIMSGAASAQASYVAGLEATAARADIAAGAVEGFSAASEDLTPVTEGVTAALDAQKVAQDDAARSAEYLIVKMLELAGKDVSAEQAARANAAAMRDVSASARDLAEAHANVITKTDELAEANAHLQDENKDTRTTTADVEAAQRALDAATAAVADSTDSQAASWEKAAASGASMSASVFTATLRTGSYEDAVVAATAEMQRQRDAFIAQQPAADIATGAAGRLADQYGLIPENVRTAYNQAGGEEVARKAQAIIDKANELDGKTATVTFTEVRNQVNNIVTTALNSLLPFENGGILAFANGGTLAGSYVAAANGLMRGVSAKVKGGDNGPGVLWGEPQVGYEWYISGKQGQERRNETFLANAAEFFGGSYTPSGAQDVAPPSGIQAANGYGPIRVNSPAVNMGGTTIMVEIDGQQLQGRIVSTVRSENSANNRTELAARR